MIQRTWIQFLGDNADDCSVYRNEIVKRLEHGVYKTIARFGSTSQALAALAAWKREIES
jgi:hypothetical protein